MAKITLTNDGITRQLQGYINRANALEGYLNRVVVEQYRNIQRSRWMTENASEGDRWEALNPSYAARKRKAYARYEGSGTKMLIATGKLFKAVIGPGAGFRKITTPRSLTISVSGVDYAEYVDEARTFTTYSDKSVREIREGVARFVIRNQIRMARVF